MNDYFGAMGTALYGKLAGGTALLARLGGTFVYADQAPDGASLPYVVFSHQGGGPENSYHGDPRSNVWYVRAYAASRAQANLIDGEAAALLHQGSLSVSGWTVFWMVRESDVALTENPPDGERVYMAGGMYRVRMSQ